MPDFCVDRITNLLFTAKHKLSRNPEPLSAEASLTCSINRVTMKLLLVFFVFIFLCNSAVTAQEWEPELMIAASQYNGDLTQQRINLPEVRPALGFNVRYNSGDYINFRAGLTYTKLVGNDKYNKSADLKSRNLNFQTDLFEFNLLAELNFLDPEEYNAYPYLFAGAGLFYFNPYTFDNNNKKVYLQPLSTEGEGLKEYPSRKKYSLLQMCIPVGFGWKMSLNDKWDIRYEFGYRVLFTDYLDDVSKTYVNLNTLQNEKGAEAASLAYRGSQPFLYENQARGNSNTKDSYFFIGIIFTKKKIK